MKRARPGIRFNLVGRVLHWSMALAILVMLFVGIGMVSSLSLRPALVELHRPLGVAILWLALLRLANRLRHPPPELPADLPAIQKAAARVSHWLLYALMLAMPLVGWAMVSAGGYPVTVSRGFDLPAIAPHDPALYAVLRTAHGWLALVLFATVLAHIAAALYHAWVRRDGVFRSMTGAAIPATPIAAPTAEPTDTYPSP